MVTKELSSYQWALPDSLDIPADELKLRLDFYTDAVIMYNLDDGVITTKLVSAMDVALALLQEVPLTSGLLPDSALWWGQGREGPQIAMWRSPRVWPAALQLEAFKPPRRFKLPMPGLIFVCTPGKPPRVYAVKRRPRSLEDTVYHAPLFNLFSNGTSCPGSHRYPESVGEIPESFFTSFFTATADHNGRSKKYPSLLQLWEEVNGKKRYPLKDLVPIGKIEDLLS